MNAPSLDGNWTNATIYPPGELQEPVVLRRPDEEMEACNCRTLKLTYDPNKEEHTGFHCDTPLSWDEVRS